MSKKVAGGSVGGRKANNEIQKIPSEYRKLVQSVKEILNFPKAEIYAMLKDCDMDPNEAVNRLLSQDSFQQVKSKKEKKKEARGRPRGTNKTYYRRARDGSDCYSGQGGSTYFSSTDTGNFQGKYKNKKESGTQGYTASSSSASGVANDHRTQNSDSLAMENKLSSISSSHRISSSQSTSGHQTAWFGAADHRSMADRLEHIHLGEHDPSEICGVDRVKADSVKEDDSAVSSEFYNNPYQAQSHPVEHRKDEGNVSSRSANFQQLTIDSPDQEALHGEDRPAVVFPNHLLISAEEGSQLKFGSFRDQEALHGEDRPAVVFPNHLLIRAEEGSHLSFGSFRDFRSRPLANNIKETSDVAPDIEHSDARNSEFGGDELLGSTSDGNMIHATRNFDDSLNSRREVIKQENSDDAQDHQYTFFAHSEPGYMYENAKRQQMYTAYDASQSNAQNQTQNRASLSNMMQGYAHSVPNTLLGQTSQNAREHEFQYSALSAAQSMQSRNSIYLAEDLRGSGIPATQPTQETIPSANIATGSALAQQFPMHPYSQPSLPLTLYANVTSYPLMPQNYPYIPSAVHQQLAAALPPGNLPQSATAPASAYGFGNSTNVGSTGSITFSQQSTPTGETLRYDFVLNHLLALQQQQQQRQNENSGMLHQGHGSTTTSDVPANTYQNLQAQQLLHQLQQSQEAAGGYHQSQQQQHFGSHPYGYPNLYQSQTEMSLDRQQQNPAGSQAGQPSNQTQHHWQNLLNR